MKEETITKIKKPYIAGEVEGYAFEKLNEWIIKIKIQMSENHKKGFKINLVFMVLFFSISFIFITN